ncbi:hypothetical protein NliqN6_5171 [Naganishia liquefaciens]|uniref:SCD domain-containing protein n=1 Tax=Naganishia liquefaciens TaxID=104408 RepID=A0A8H3TX92_9TREE|nr:hypothetical protein NliqN6_5171 [Naganishia liquefaciens]
MSLLAHEMPVDAEGAGAGAGARRSSRKRRAPENFMMDTAGKGGKAVREEGDEEEDEEDEEEEEEDDDDDSDQDANPPPKKRKTASATATQRGAGGRQAKPKATVAATARAKPAATKATQADTTGQSIVKDDNGLFNALVQPDLALEQFVEDWVADYLSSRGEDEKIHVQELVVFLFRCCGVGCEIDMDEAVDLDRPDGMMDDIHEEMLQTGEASFSSHMFPTRVYPPPPPPPPPLTPQTPIYPLLSRTKLYKPFRKSLDTMIKSLVTHLARSPVLYTTVSSPPPKSGPTTPLITLLLKWLTPMSTSPHRAIRHTATLMALTLGEALCIEAQARAHQVAEAMRKRDAEARKRSKDKVVVRNFEASIRDLAGKKDVVGEYLRDIVLAFFVHRYRDRDPLIRADCLREMGLWMKHYPEKYVNTEHLQYMDSGLTDLDGHVRLEAIKALVPLYGPDTRITSMTTFTSRALPRIIDMAIRDIDIRIRIQAIRVLCQLDAAGVLQDEEEEQRYHIACLVFDKEPRIRKAVAGLIKSMWEEQCEEMKSKDESEPVKNKGKDDGAEDEERALRIGWKCLASLLIQLSNQLSASLQNDPTDMDDSTTESQTERARQVLSSVSGQAFSMETHASIAIDALWTEMSLVQDAEALLAFLAADQSVLEKEERPWALTDDEQTFLLKMLVSGGRKLVDADKHKRKEDDDTETEQVKLTRKLIDTVPKLISKHQADPVRVSNVLELAGLMHLPIYAEMRATDSYERLWGDLIRQYLRHTDHLVLQRLLQLLRSLIATADLKTVNDAKLQELKDGLVSNLQESIGDVDVGSSSLEEEQLHNIESAAFRLRMLFPQMDIRDIFDDDEAGAGLWSIMLAIADRGNLGYKEEVKLVEHAMKILVWYLSWTAVKITQEDVDNEATLAKVTKHRDETLRVLNEYAVGNHSNADEAVRREAVTDLLRFYVIFRPAAAKEGTSISPCQTVLSKTMDDALQYRCAGTIQAAIEKYSDNVIDKPPVRGSDASSVLSDSDNEPKRAKKVTPASIAYTAEFQTLIWSYISAMRAGVLESLHAGILLKEYGRLDKAFDAGLQVVIEILQDEGIYNGDGETVVKVIGKALEESFDYHLDADSNPEPTTTLGLAKLVTPAFFIHKSHFRIERKLAADNVVDFHEDGIAFCLKKYAALARSEKNVKDKTTKDRLKKREQACLSYFKVLAVLVPALTGRDALKVKTRLAELLHEQTEIEWRKAKGFDAIAAYEKRLVTVASGDSVVKAASKAQQAHDRANHDAAEPDALRPAVAPKTPERPRPVRRTRANPDVVTPVQDANNEAVGGEEADEEADEEAARDEQAQQEDDQVDDEREDQDDASNDQEEELQEPILHAPEASFEIESLPEDDIEQAPTQGSPGMQDPAGEQPIDPASPVASEGSALSDAASPRRLTRASSVLSFGNVQPTKRVRRR